MYKIPKQVHSSPILIPYFVRSHFNILRVAYFLLSDSFLRDSLTKFFNSLQLSLLHQQNKCLAKITKRLTVWYFKLHSEIIFFKKNIYVYVWEFDVKHFPQILLSRQRRPQEIFRKYLQYYGRKIMGCLCVIFKFYVQENRFVEQKLKGKLIVENTYSKYVI
jgi:hypothetical protein